MTQTASWTGTLLFYCVDVLKSIALGSADTNKVTPDIMAWLATRVYVPVLGCATMFLGEAKLGISLRCLTKQVHAAILMTNQSLVAHKKIISQERYARTRKNY